MSPVHAHDIRGKTLIRSLLIGLSFLRPRCWTPLSNADDVSYPPRIRVAHRFHPLFGRELESVKPRMSYGDDLVKQILGLRIASAYACSGHMPMVQ